MGGLAQVGNVGVATGKALRHQLARQQEVGAALELEEDRRQLVHRLGAHDVEPRHAVERLLQRNGDQLLHFGGGKPETWGLNLYPRWRELRKDVHRHAAKSVDPEDHHPRGNGNHQEPELQARSDDPTKHGWRLPWPVNVQPRTRSRTARPRRRSPPQYRQVDRPTEPPGRPGRSRH